MAFVHGANSRIYINDQFVSGYISGFSVSSERKLADVTVQGSGGSNSIPGFIDGSMTIDGFLTTQAALGQPVAIQNLLRNASQTEHGVLTTAAPAGLAVGKPCFILRGDASKFELESKVDDAVSISYEAQGEDGVDFGTLLTDGVAKGTTGAYASVNDVTAATTNGGVAMLHVVSKSGTTPTLDVKVQHSADNSTFADLVTFTQATDTTAEYKVVAKGTTVNKYLKVTYTIGGTTPNFAFLVSFGRR